MMPLRKQAALTVFRSRLPRSCIVIASDRWFVVPYEATKPFKIKFFGFCLCLFAILPYLCIRKHVLLNLSVMSRSNVINVFIVILNGLITILQNFV